MICFDCFFMPLLYGPSSGMIIGCSMQAAKSLSYVEFGQLLWFYGQRIIPRYQAKPRLQSLISDAVRDLEPLHGSDFLPRGVDYGIFAILLDVMPAHKEIYVNIVYPDKCTMVHRLGRRTEQQVPVGNVAFVTIESKGFHYSVEFPEGDVHLGLMSDPFGEGTQYGQVVSMSAAGDFALLDEEYGHLLRGEN